MKINLLCFIFLLVVVGCRTKTTTKMAANSFSIEQDTLVVKMKKNPGQGLFLFGMTSSYYLDTALQQQIAIVLPNDIERIKRSCIYIDYTADKANVINIIEGYKNGEMVYVVDQNNNNNLTDDKVRLVKEMNWEAPQDTVACSFVRIEGAKKVKDTGYITMGYMGDKSLGIGRLEHLEGNVTIGNKNYTVAVNNNRSINLSYQPFEWMELAVTAQGQQYKDTLNTRDIVRYKECVKLGDSYYSFADIDKKGEYITLIKNKNFKDKVGTEVGMLAPDFTATTVYGNVLVKKGPPHRYMLIVNSCECGGDKESLQAYYDIATTYAHKAYVIHLDGAIKNAGKGTHIDVAQKENKDIFEKYRNSEYCSRVCYVIDENNRLVDKFQSKDWRTELPKILKL